MHQTQASQNILDSKAHRTFLTCTVGTQDSCHKTHRLSAPQIKTHRLSAPQICLPRSPELSPCRHCHLAETTRGLLPQFPCGSSSSSRLIMFGLIESFFLSCLSSIQIERILAETFHGLLTRCRITKAKTVCWHCHTTNATSSRALFFSKFLSKERCITNTGHHQPEKFPTL